MTLTVACGGACDSGSDHGGLVMAFMSTMVLGLKRRENKQDREGNKRMRKEEREESEII